MNVDPSAARHAHVALTKAISSADTTRSHEAFSRSLQRQGIRVDADTLVRGNRAGDGSRAAAPAQPAPPADEGVVVAASEPVVESGVQATPDANTDEPTPQPALAGDVNGDGVVNVFDFGALAAGFGTDNAEADLDDSGTVDDADATILRDNFGRTLETRAATPFRARGPRNPLSADINHDGAVDVLDFGRFAASYAAKSAEADIVNDGVVNELDFAVFKGLFQSGA